MPRGKNRPDTQCNINDTRYTFMGKKVKCSRKTNFEKIGKKHYRLTGLTHGKKPCADGKSMCTGVVRRARGRYGTGVTGKTLAPGTKLYFNMLDVYAARTAKAEKAAITRKNNKKSRKSIGKARMRSTAFE